MRTCPCYQGKYQGRGKMRPRAVRVSTLCDRAQMNPAPKSVANIREELGRINPCTVYVSRGAKCIDQAGEFGPHGAPERSIDICGSVAEVCARLIKL
jgi:hypothetical protein